MNILLTNDDGYNFHGLSLLREKLKKYGHVVVVAPMSAMSGMSVAIIFGRPVKVKKNQDDVYAMEGTPADCVAFGLSSLDTKFDLVVSGCNDGSNICMDVLYSGTVGACLQALSYRVPAIAFSAYEGKFEPAEKNIELVMDYILNNNLLSTEYLLNVNFPKDNETKGIKMTHYHYRKETTYYVKSGDEQYLAKRDVLDELCEDKDSDAYAVHHGYISINKLNKMI